MNRELSNLPLRQAPATLLPRVLAAIAARHSLPWWRQTWWTWPGPARLGSVLAAVALVGLLTYAAMLLGAGLSLAGLAQQFSAWLAPLAPLWNAFSALVAALALVVSKADNLVLLAGVLCLLAVYLSGIGLGTVFYRLAFQK